MTDESRVRLRHACEEGYPQEACGLLLGRSEAGVRRVRAAHPVRNVERDGRFGYRVDPDDFLRADTVARETGDEILGVFHSHPDGSAEPSAVDLRDAQEGWSYLIVSVVGASGGRRRGRAIAERSWTLDLTGDIRRLVSEPLVREG